MVIRFINVRPKSALLQTCCTHRRPPFLNLRPKLWESHCHMTRYLPPKVGQEAKRTVVYIVVDVDGVCCLCLVLTAAAACCCCTKPCLPWNLGFGYPSSVTICKPLDA